MRFGTRRALAGAQTVGYDFYLNSAASPGGNGVTPDSAFKTVASLLTALGSSSNKRIGIKYGSVLDESLILTSSHRGTVIDSYGNPADGKPLWRCDEAIESGDFSLASGRTAVYEVTLAVEPELVAAAEYAGIWEDGVALSLSAVDLSANEGKPGTFWHGTITDLSSITVYIHPYGSTNPTSDGKSYRYAKRQGLNCWSAEDVTIRNQQGRRSYTSYGSITGGRGCLIEDCDVLEGNSHNIFYRLGPSASGQTAVLRRILARDTFRPDQSPTLYIGFEQTIPSGSKAHLDSCRGEITYNSRLPIQNVTAATSASPCVITIAGHGFANNDVVLAKNFTGPWAALNGVRFSAASVATDTFALQTIQTTPDTSPILGAQMNYSTAALAAYSGNGGTFELYPYIPAVNCFYAHGTGSFDVIDYNECESEGCGAAFAGANTTLTKITEGFGKQFNVGLNAITGQVIVSGLELTNSPAIVGAVMGRTGSSTSDFDISNMTVRINSTGNFQVIHAGSDLSMQSCTTYGCNAVVTCNVANVTLDLLDNSYVPEGRQFNAYNIGSSATGLTFSSDRNNFNGASANIIYLGTTYAAFADYKTASGQDANSTA